jgi:hypothetical protein
LEVLMELEVVEEVQRRCDVAPILSKARPSGQSRHQIAASNTCRLQEKLRFPVAHQKHWAYTSVSRCSSGSPPNFRRYPRESVFSGN